MTASPNAGPSVQMNRVKGGYPVQEQDEVAYMEKQPKAVEKASHLAQLMIEEPHRFALHGDQQLMSSGLDALKALFDFCMETEGPAIPAIAEALRSAFPDDETNGGTAVTRSAGGKRKRRGTSAGSTSQAHRLFEPTPLGELVIDNMIDAQIWDQLELRNDKICTLLDAVIVTEQDGDAEDADEESDEISENDDEALDEVERKNRKRRSLVQVDDDDQDDHDDEEDSGMPDEEMLHNLSELGDADLRALGIDPAQRAVIQSISEEVGETAVDQDSEEDDEDGHGYPGASDLSDDDELSGVIVTEPLLTEAEQQKRKAAAEAEERRQLRNQRQLAKMMQRLHKDERDDDEESEDEDNEDDESYEYEDDSENEEEEEDDDDEEEEEEEEEANVKSLLDSLDEPQSNAPPSAISKGRRSAAVDDAFFSIDQFNKDTDDYGDEGVDLGDDFDLFKSMDDQERQEQETPLYYADFFAPPPNKSFSPQKATKTDRADGAGVLPSLIGASQSVPGAPRRVPSVRFNDSVSVRRIKARKNQEMPITKELIEMLQQQSSGDDQEHGDDEEDDDEDQDDDERSSDSGKEEEDDSVDDDASMEDEDSEDTDDDNNSYKKGRSVTDFERSTFADSKEQRGRTDELLQNEGSDVDAENETFERVAGDLFADEESADDADQTSRSRHQQRLSALQQEIAQLERENVGKKDWTLMGEAGSRARPENSLLEEDIEFESNRKEKPVNTLESTQSIEDMIKKRILDNQFDDVQRRATLQPLDFIPSKILELSDTKNPKSLDQVYEDDFGGVADAQGARLDKELQKEHEEIDELYNRLEEQLDALSNAHFTPKAPKLSIRTISDAATISLEESLPSTMNNGTQLAPEEVYNAGAHNSALQGVSAEMTPEEKQKRHRQLREEKRARNERIADHRRNVEIHREAFGQSRGGRFVGASAGGAGVGKPGSPREAAQKEEALRKLMGNKGVTVVGKGGTHTNGTKKGQQTTSNTAGNASRFKL